MMVEDIRLEILWYCRAKSGYMLPSDIATALDLSIPDTLEAMEVLADAGDLERCTVLDKLLHDTL